MDVRSMREIAEKLLQQEDPSKAVAAVERFAKGVGVEKLFRFTCFSWRRIVLAHELCQEQVPGKSKEKYQVPDYLCVVETHAGGELPVLVEVKSVDEAKQTFKHSRQQHDQLQAYSKAVGIQLVYAIFWSRFRDWTLVPSDALKGESSTLKVGILDAMMTDVSAAFGEKHLFVPGPVRRVTVCDRKANTEEHIGHEKYGPVVRWNVDVGGKPGQENDFATSAVIDACISMKQVSAKPLDDHTTEVTDQTDETNIIKLTKACISLYALPDRDDEYGHLAVGATETDAHDMAALVTAFADTYGIAVVLLLPGNLTSEGRDLLTKVLGELPKLEKE